MRVRRTGSTPQRLEKPKTGAPKPADRKPPPDAGAVAARWSKASGADAHGQLSETVRAAASKGVSYENLRGPDVPVYRGRVVIEEGEARLKTEAGTFALVTNGAAPWNLRWSGELASFVGQVVTVRAQPSTSGKVLEVREFSPGTSDAFVHGRVLIKGDDVFINVRPGKQVRVASPELAAVLKDWERTAFILPGEVRWSADTQEWTFEGGLDSVYLLTKLNPGEGVYYADTPFERVHLSVSANLGGVLPNEKMGQRIFVHGKLLPKPEGGREPNRRYFEADWVGGGISPAVVARGETAPANLTFASDTGREPPPPPAEAVAFEPELAHLPHGTKSGLFLRDGVLERWFEGRKLAQGPVDPAGRPHGEWVELSATPRAGEVSADGEAPFDYAETLRGSYEHGRRVGQWTQLLEGRPANAWQWEDGRLVANGHLDAEGRPHDAWTLVAADGFRDGGEGIYSHGAKVSRWNWYAEGTTDYARAELYHPNGQLAARGDERGVMGDDGVVKTYRVGRWDFFATDGRPLGTVDYRREQQVDVEQQGPLGNGESWSWDKAPPPD